MVGAYGTCAEARADRVGGGRASAEDRRGEADAAQRLDDQQEIVGEAAEKEHVRPRAHHGRDDGRGIGKALLNHVVDLAADSGFHAVMARIEASGTASRALHTSCGFQLVGIERQIGRKFNRWLDVALMQCLVGERG